MLWLSRVLRPRGGWITLIFLLLTLLCLPMGVIDAGWLIGAIALVGLVLPAGWLGYALAQSRLPGWLVGLLGFLSGIEVSTIAVGRLLPAPGVLWRELGYAVRWLLAGLGGHWSADLPLVSLAPDVWARLQTLLERLTAWQQASATGTVSRDTLVVLLFASIVVWWAAYFAGWRLVRGNALWALLPAGTLLLSNVALTFGRGMAYLRLYLCGALVLLAMGHIDREVQRWERERLDYSYEVRRSAQFYGVVLAVLIAAAGFLVPYFTARQAMEFFWKYAYDPYQKFTTRLDKMFAGRNPVSTPTPSLARGGSDSHNLSGEVSPGKDVVFYVSTSDPEPLPPEARMMQHGDQPEAPQHYWRELTYDTYTGRGWKNSTTQRASHPPGDLLASPTYPHSVLTQTYSLVALGSDVAPAVNEPVQVLDVSSALMERQGNDAAGLVVDGRDYTVVSDVPVPTLTELQEAGTDYPPEIAQRYLALPEIPERVRQLAEDLTAKAQTPYAKAVAIEQHLRSYDYDLKIPPPPEGMDVTDYLLFKTRRGYCDYYATAMVVMLRAVGVPARYASGYVMGRFDYSRHAYAVTESDAHAWAEVYFPGYGWIEFEPTPYRTAFVRPLGGNTLSVTAPTPAASLPWWQTQRLPTAAGTVLLLAVLALGGLVWLAVSTLRSWQRVRTVQMARRVYTQMLRWAERVHMGPSSGDTPLEFSRRLGEGLEKRGAWAQGAAEEARIIGETYVYARYAPHPPSARDAGRALTAWGKLRGRLRWVFFWRW